MNKKEFDKYYSNFDDNNPMIKRKYLHTFRVVEYAKQIALSENLNEEDTNLAVTAALLHDIGRFYQATKYNTFIDSLSVDYGDLGYDILNKDDYILNYVDAKDKDIILKAVKYHNKKYLIDGLSKKEELITKIVRDADKIDILDTQCNSINDNSTKLNENAFKEVLEHKLCTNEYITDEANMILRMLAFIFDLNFKESFRILEKINIVDRKIDILKEHIKSDEITRLEIELKNYINEREY